VAISPDLVSFIQHGFGYCDLRRGGGIHHVAGEASCISLVAGALQCSLLLGHPADDGSPWPLEPLGRGGYFTMRSSASV
jgi:hypothetical protein